MAVIHDSKSIMKFFSNKINYIAYVILAVFAFYINYFFSNIGIYPIDTFSFFDSGYLITKGYHPIKDFWVISGVLIDYIQALFFLIFGNNWNAYIFHSSLLNASVSIFLFFFLNSLRKNLYSNFFLSVCFATLCYPVAGTPFPYQHSFIISLISILIFYMAVYKENKKYWFILPIFMLCSFLSMQLPSGIINLIILIFAFIYFLKINKNHFYYFLIGAAISLLLLFIYLIYVDINLKDFVIQIILFPLSIGEGRILNDEKAYQSAKLLNKLTLRGTLGHFKFIFLFTLANLISLIIYLKKNEGVVFKKEILLNFFIILCTISFIFHQLITANQTFIFSLIPFLCGLFFIQLNDLQKKVSKKINIFIILVVAFSTFKYHKDYNINRKFMDLQNTDLSKSIEAKILNVKFNNLKWITPFYFNKDPKKEIEYLKEALQIISNEDEKKFAVITHYQFFSVLTEKKINIFNRWYFAGNNTHPVNSQSKYYSYYNEKINNLVQEKGIDKIYLVKTHPKEFHYINLNNIFKNFCLREKKYNPIFSLVSIKKC